jgi:hypothetical protein
LNLNGKLAELHFTMWLLRKGYDVFHPVDTSSSADVVWRAGPGDPWRSAQVKKVYEKDGHLTVNITKRDGSLYDTTEVDYVAFVDYDDGILWLMRADAPHRNRRICDYTRVRITKHFHKYMRSL